MCQLLSIARYYCNCNGSVFFYDGLSSDNVAQVGSFGFGVERIFARANDEFFLRVCVSVECETMPRFCLINVSVIFGTGVKKKC